MTGIRTTTRLEELQRLHRVTRLQRDAAARRGEPTHQHDHLLAALTREITHASRRPRPEVAAAVRATDTSVQDRLHALGVTALDVKRWAVATGRLPAVVRGRVSGLLVDAYAHAHQPQETT